MNCLVDALPYLGVALLMVVMLAAALALVSADHSDRRRPR